METYDTIRQHYKPKRIKVLLIAESPPPPASVGGSRHFYRTDKLRSDDRLFTNTIRALYPEAVDVPEAELEAHKQEWLQKFQAAGWYMIEALEVSQQHAVTKPERQAKIKESLPRLLERVRELAGPDTKIILIKSNVFDVAAGPLREAGFTVLNKQLVDYPGRFNQRAYREKLSRLASIKASPADD
ncbi:MAG TPA: hypothetical protein VLH86_00815 [Patescibacteria group bacterium]|nr:hypothetical protein [Patescibacteria group bacterium]